MPFFETTARACQRLFNMYCDGSSQQYSDVRMCFDSLSFPMDFNRILFFSFLLLKKCWVFLCLCRHQLKRNEMKWLSQEIQSTEHYTSYFDGQSYETINCRMIWWQQRKKEKHGWSHHSCYPNNQYKMIFLPNLLVCSIFSLRLSIQSRQYFVNVAKSMQRLCTDRTIEDDEQHAVHSIDGFFLSSSFFS